MTMGTIHKLYPNARDSLDGDLFLAFKIYYETHRDQLFHALLHDKQATIVTDTGKQIICTLQQLKQKDFVNNPYGRVYQILLEDDEKKRFGCHIEHRLPPYEESITLNPSSWLVYNKKFPRVFSDSIKTQSYKPSTELSLAQMSEK